MRNAWYFVVPVVVSVVTACGSESPISTQEDEGNSASAFSKGRCVNGPCCPVGSISERGTNADDRIFRDEANLCVYAGAGNDEVGVTGDTSILLGGAGNDTLYARANDSDRLIGGEGNDVLAGWGQTVAYGGLGNDKIVTQGRNDFVVPGPGKDIVDTGAGDDTVRIFQECELQPGEALHGGPGFDTLILPMHDSSYDPATAVAYLATIGVTYDGFENIIVKTPSACRSECASGLAPCSGPAFGSCVDGDAPGEKKCVCSGDWVGEECNEIPPISCDTCTPGGILPPTHPPTSP